MLGQFETISSASLERSWASSNPWWPGISPKQRYSELAHFLSREVLLVAWDWPSSSAANGMGLAELLSNEMLLTTP
jgi:hypothetical protein